MNTLEKESLWCRFLSPAFKPHHDCMILNTTTSTSKLPKNNCNIILRAIFCTGSLGRNLKVCGRGPRDISSAGHMHEEKHAL
jgi:hypothetical protein